MSDDHTEIYEFEGFRLNVTERFLVSADGDRLELSDKAFETLCVLVRNSGHLVKKSELLDQVWADSFVEENNLNKCIHTLRRGLGETNGGPQFIETVKKHGFRFVADVHRVSDNGAGGPEVNGFKPVETASAPTGPTETRADQPKSAPSRSRLPIFVLAAVLLLGAVALAGYMLLGPSTSTVADKGKISLAVLPLKPIDANNRDNLYEVGVADAIISSLSQVQGFEVRSLDAVRDYNSINQDPVIAGREQKVDYVLAPNYQLAGGKIRITAPLINVASGKVEDTLKFETEATSHFDVQDAIAGEVGNKLARFFGVAIGPASKRGTTNEEAYGLYLQGSALVDKRTLREIRKAVEYLEQAVRLDPNYALAYARLANAQSASAERDASDPQDQYLKAKAAIERALAIDDNLAEAHSYLGEIKSNFEGDYAGAEREHKHAIALNPNSSVAHRVYSIMLTSLGRHDEAIAEIKTAIDLEPASALGRMMLGLSLVMARRYDEAITELERTTEMDPERFHAHFQLSTAYRLTGDDDRAFESFVKTRILGGDAPGEINLWRTTYAKSGWHGVLERQLDGARADEKSGKPNYRLLSRLSSELGQGEQAIAYLEKDLVQYGTITMLKVHPRYDFLRDDPRFDELLKRRGLK